MTLNEEIKAYNVEAEYKLCFNTIVSFCQKVHKKKLRYKKLCDELDKIKVLFTGFINIISDYDYSAFVTFPLEKEEIVINIVIISASKKEKIKIYKLKFKNIFEWKDKAREIMCICKYDIIPDLLYTRSAGEIM